MDNCDSHSGSLWLLLTLSGFHWLSLALTGSLPVSLWLSMALCGSHSGSHWLSLPLSGIFWPSMAHYCSLISRIQPLIGTQGPCSPLIADATMKHFNPLWCEGYMVVVKVIIIIYRTIVFIIIYCQRREVVVVNVCLVALGQIGVGGKLQGKQAMRRS